MHMTAARRMPKWIAYLALAVLFLIGFGLRFFRLDVVPLGGHGDVAWNGMVALDWLHGGIWPFYVYHVYAPEPAIMYAQGLSILLFGVNFFAMRAVTELASALAILVGWQAARRLGGKDSARTAWLFALAYAVSFYPIILAQTGQRAQTFPLLTLALTMFFAYAWRSGRWWAFIASALVMALANYTYIPGRLMPILLALWIGYGFLAERDRLKAIWKQLVAMYALSLVLVLPQVVMYIQTPEAFTARSDQSAGELVFKAGLPLGGLLLTIGQKILGEFAIFILPWNGAYSAMGQPLLPILIFVGVVAAVVFAIRNPRDRSLWWPIIAIPIMFLTDIVSGTQSDPHGLRMIGDMSFAFLLGARGLAGLWSWAESRFHLANRRALIAGGLSLLIAAQGLWQIAQYQFAYVPALERQPDTSDRLEASDVFLTQLIQRHEHDGVPILITLDDFTRSNIPFLLSGDYPVRGSAIGADQSFNFPSGGRALVVWPANPQRPRHDGIPPEQDGRAWVMLLGGQMRLLPPLTADAGQRVQAVIGAAQPLDRIADWLGQPVAAIYPVGLSASDFDARIAPSGANLNNEVKLVGYGVDGRSLSPGRPLWVTLYFEASPHARDEYEFYVQVLDKNGSAVAKMHRWVLDGMYRTQLWQPTEIVPVRTLLSIPPDLKPGEYTLITDLFRVLQNTSLEVLDQTGAKVADHVTLSGFKVPIPKAEVTLPAPERPIEFAGEIRLAGMKVGLDTRALTFAADWQAIKPPDRSHTLFIHVTGPDGKIAAQLDTLPLGGSYPTDVWDKDEVIPETYSIPLPDHLAAGKYEVTIGWYTLPEGTRLDASLGGSPVQDNQMAIYSFTLP